MRGVGAPPLRRRKPQPCPQFAMLRCRIAENALVCVVAEKDYTNSPVIQTGYEIVYGIKHGLDNGRDMDGELLIANAACCCSDYIHTIEHKENLSIRKGAGLGRADCKPKVNGDLGCSLSDPGWPGARDCEGWHG